MKHWTVLERPASSSDLNHIQNLWQDLKTAVGGGQTCWTLKHGRIQAVCCLTVGQIMSRKVKQAHQWQQ
jgi:hypothetical protein